MLVKNFVKKIWEKKLKAFVNKNIYLLKIYIQKTVSVKKIWARHKQEVFLPISGCICDGPVAIPVCLLCWCALLLFCAAPHGVKGFPLPCAGFAVSTMLPVFFMCLSLLCWAFLVRAILDPLGHRWSCKQKKSLAVLQTRMNSTLAFNLWGQLKKVL